MISRPLNQWQQVTLEMVPSTATLSFDGRLAHSAPNGIGR